MKRPLALLLWCSLCTCTWAQTELPRWSYGLRLGVVASSFGGEAGLPSYGRQARWGWQAGGVVQYGFGGAWAVAAEPGYVQKGQTYVSDATTTRFTLDYLELPLLAAWHKALGAAWLLRLASGPVLAATLQAQRNGENLNIGNNTNDDVRSWDAGWEARLGLGRKLGGWLVQLELRGQWGLQNTNPQKSPGAMLYNSLYGLSLGLLRWK